MEAETPDTSWVSSATKTSSWPIDHGSVDDSVTFESSISAADADSDDDSDHTASLKRRTPLILRRPSPDSGPCEITVCFAHQHEIRQVYVRSTARVYEIYYAADEKGGNDYLCTVRCCLAAQNEGPVQVTDAVGSMPAIDGGSNQCGEAGHSGTESGSSANEDGWVDVDPSGFDGGEHSLSNRTENCSGKGNQDLFEATAEISDADPVKSVTLRLLSVQSGDYIYIDEVYIYADPIISEDTDSSANMPVNSSGSALMSMLVPTLLQLSKSRTSQMQQRNDYAATERRDNLGGEDKSIAAPMSSNTFYSERMPSSTTDGASVHASQPEVPVQTQDHQSRPYSTAGETRFSFSHVEKTLDELVSRISRIENFCLRFEENMLKPISSMEARLEKVEQQLESLFKNLGACRMSASDFSCHNSESNFTRLNGNNCHGHTISDLVKSDDICEVILVQPSETSSSANAVQPSSMPDLLKNDEFGHAELLVLPSETSLFAYAVPPSDVPSSASASLLHPSLVVTAPDFSCVDDDIDEEQNEVIEAVNHLPKESSKKPLSIDDALASALSGFLSSASIDPSKCADMVQEAPDLPGVERIGENSPLAVIHYVQPVVFSINADRSDEPLNIFHKESELIEVQESLACDDSCAETTNAVGQDHIFEQDSFKSADSSVGSVFNLDKGNKEDSCSIAELGSIEADNATCEAMVSEFSDNPAALHSTFLNDDCVVALELPRGNIDSSCSEEVLKADSDALQNMLELPVSRTVDFEIPILDVKFSSLENSSGKSSLEALLIDMPESHNVLCVRQDNESSLGEPTDLVILEDGDSATSGTPDSQFFLDNYDSCCLPSNKEEERQDPRSFSDQDVCASLI